MSFLQVKKTDYKRVRPRDKKGHTDDMSWSGSTVRVESPARSTCELGRKGRSLHGKESEGSRRS